MTEQLQVNSVSVREDAASHPMWARSHPDWGRLYQRPGPLVEGDLRAAVREGRLMPSVTTVIGSADKPFLRDWTARLAVEAYDDARLQWPDQAAAKPRAAQRWAVSAAERYTQFRSDVGTAVHETVEALITGRPVPAVDPSYAAEVAARVRGFELFHRDLKPVFSAVEATLFGVTGDGDGFAGTADFVADINGMRVVGDWKTSKRVNRDHAMQVEALSRTLQMVDGSSLVEVPWAGMAPSGVIVSLKPDAYEVVPVSFTGAAWRGFEGLRRAWQWMHIDADDVSVAAVGDPRAWFGFAMAGNGVDLSDPTGM